MIVGLSEALAEADRRGIALAAVNTPFFESLLATIDVAERSDVPVILQHAQVHEGVMPLADIGPAMVELARRSPARFVLHIDHGDDIDYIERGLDLGFNSAMIDGSRLPYEENVARTSEVVAMAKARGIDVEGEIGVMTGNENGDESQGVADETLYTDPGQAAEFVRRTGVSALAASFGTVHGMYNREPRIDYALIERLRAGLGVPLVMHGGSGLSPEEYRRCVAGGVRKINYYTYAAKAALDAFSGAVDDGATLFPQAALAARKAVAEDIGRFVQIISTPEGAR